MRRFVDTAATGLLTAHEHRTAPPQGGNRVVVRRERAVGILHVLGIGQGAFLSNDERIALELAAGRDPGELILVSHRLIELRQMRGRVRRGHNEEVGVAECEHLRIERIAHQVEPGTRDIDIVERLLRRATIGEHGLQRLGVPIVGVLQDHRRGLQIARRGAFSSAACNSASVVAPSGSCIAAARPTQTGADGDESAAPGGIHFVHAGVAWLRVPSTAFARRRPRVFDGRVARQQRGTQSLEAKTGAHAFQPPRLIRKL